MLVFFTILLFWLVIRITSCHNTWVVRGNPKPDKHWTDLVLTRSNTNMKHNVQTHTPSHRDAYRDDPQDLKPRLELRPFVGQRRLFSANFLYYSKHPDPSGTGRYYRNGRFGNVYDLVTGLPVAARGKGTNSDHMWIPFSEWPQDIWHITDIPNMQKVSFTGNVVEYTTEEKQRQHGKDHVDYRIAQVDDVLDWERWENDMRILADYEAGCPDVPHYSPGEYSTFIPSLGTGQNPNIDDSEIL